MADFSSWSHENLAKFATDAQLKLLQQERQIEHLKQDLKDALEACRQIMRKGASQSGQ